MKTIALAVFVFIFVSPAFAQTKPNDIYNPSADMHAAIDSSVAAAQRQNKHILLMFGGNWCPWCHRLHGLFQSDADIQSLLERSYIIVMVDIGETADKPLNRDLLKKNRVEGFGYPALAVLDQEGKLLSAQSTGVLEKGKGHDPKRVLAYLTAQAPHPGE